MHLISRYHSTVINVHSVKVWLGNYIVELWTLGTMIVMTWTGNHILANNILEDNTCSSKSVDIVTIGGWMQGYWTMSTLVIIRY